MIFVAFGITGISLQWQQEWPTVPLSLQVQSGSQRLCVLIMKQESVNVFSHGSKLSVATMLCCCFSLWQATAPFLQFGAVGALTLLSSFVFHGFDRAKTGMWMTSFKSSHRRDSYAITQHFSRQQHCHCFAKTLYFPIVKIMALTRKQLLHDKDKMP